MNRSRWKNKIYTSGNHPVCDVTKGTIIYRFSDNCEAAPLGVEDEK